MGIVAGVSAVKRIPVDGCHKLLACGISRKHLKAQVKRGLQLRAQRGNYNAAVGVVSAA